MEAVPLSRNPSHSSRYSWS
uniref:Uncharacterized protein n=1 Tax=Anguilla anguilla TaxID=7936 RepID=A0A0E9VCQ1_ANGAN